MSDIRMVADHVCIGVSDMDQAVRWYTDVLGFEVDLEWTVPELPGFRLAYIKKGDFRIELIDPGEAEKKPMEPMAFDEFLRLRGFSHVCFRVDDVDAAVNHVRGHGVAIEAGPEDFPDVGRRVAFIRDSDGNYLEFAGTMKGEG